MNFDKIIAWVACFPPLSLTQAQRLREVADDLVAELKRREHLASAAQEQLKELAKSHGFDTVEEFLAVVQGKGKMSSAGQGGKSSRSGVRRPYLDPLNPTKLYALPKRYPPPPALAQRIKEGWKPEELHYKNIALAAAAKGIELDYDPVERYKELVAQTPLSRPRR